MRESNPFLSYDSITVLFTTGPFCGVISEIGGVISELGGVISEINHLVLSNLIGQKHCRTCNHLATACYDMFITKNYEKKQNKRSRDYNIDCRFTHSIQSAYNNNNQQ